MKQPFKGRNIISPIFSVLLPLLFSILIFSSGCDSSQGVKIGDTPPKISSRDIYGEDNRQAMLKAKVVIIYFWTNSCCGDSLKKLEPLYTREKDKGLALLAVDVGDAKGIVESYARSNALTFTMLADENARIFKQYQVFGFPTIFILDKNGVVREKIMGDIPIDKLEKLVVKQFNIQKEMEASYEKIHSK